MHIGMIGTQNRFYSSFLKLRVGVSAPPSAAPVQRLVGQIRRCNLVWPTKRCTGAALAGVLIPSTYTLAGAALAGLTAFLS